MSSPASRKAEPQGAPAADDAVALLRELIERQRQTDVKVAMLQTAIERIAAAIEASAADESQQSDENYPKDALTIKQAAHLAGKDADTIRRWVERFDLGRFVVCGHILISRSRLETFLAARRPRDE
jgi:type I site-specific restriction endonuclease